MTIVKEIKRTDDAILSVIEDAIDVLTDLMRQMPVDVEYRVSNRPQGMRIVIDLDQERMDQLVDHFNKLYGA